MYKSFDDIPDHYVEFLKEQEEYSFFSGFHWFKYLAETTLQAHEKLAIYGLEGCTPTPTLDALFVGRSPAGQNGSVLQKRRISGNSLASLTNYQSPRFSVLVSPSVVAPATAVAQLAEQICQDEMGWRLIDINLIERESPIFANLVH